MVRRCGKIKIIKIIKIDRIWWRQAEKEEILKNERGNLKMEEQGKGEKKERKVGAR